MNLQDRKEIKAIIKDIVKVVNANSLFSNEELEQEYLKQIEINNFSAMLRFLQDEVNEYKIKITEAIKDSDSIKFDKYSEIRKNLNYDIKALKELIF